MTESVDGLSHEVTALSFVYEICDDLQFALASGIFVANPENCPQIMQSGSSKVFAEM